jgi:signal transduction histidine kinase/ActR/RegA family two-component response regulator
MRLRSSLFLLSLATAIPLVAFGLLAATFVVRLENESLVSAAKARNRAAMSAVDAELRGAVDMLKALSVARSLATDDLAAFDTLGRSVLATQPSWVTLLLHDPSGRQIVNAGAPTGTPLPDKPAAPASIETAIRTGQPVVDNLVSAQTPQFRGQLGIPIRVPIVRDGHAVYVLTAVLSPETFQRLLVGQDLPDGWVSGLVDGEGRLIARVPMIVPGTPASRDYMRHVEGAREGWYRGKTIEGEDTYTAFFRSDLTGWTIGYAMPAAAVSGGVARAAWLMGAGIAVSLVAAALIGVWLSRRIAQPMSQLADAAALLANGSVPPRVSSTIDEVERLSIALDDAANAITERDGDLRTSEARLREQADELRRANTNKSHFLALLSHELRNPLAPLRTGLALLKLRHDPQGLAETRTMMERQIAHLVRLIDDLLDVSRIDRGQLELRRERIALDGVVRSAIETARPGIQLKQQELVVRYAPEPLYVDGDAVRLSQVVSNLLNNASKFTPAYGHIEIATGHEGDEVTITVQDDGIGFPSDESERIFDMFVQLDSSRNRAAAGLGLGLSLVRSVVEMHGGRIEARSAGVGRGAAFTVRLRRSATPKPLAVSQPHAIPSSKNRVLVVDDNTDAADSLAELLRLEGFDVHVSYDGAKALEVAKVFHPDVAFIDLNLPGLSGIELALALRREPWAAGLRLIAVTGMGQQSDLEATRAAGFHVHLTKPVEAEVIARLASGPSAHIVALRSQRAG